MNPGSFSIICEYAVVSCRSINCNAGFSSHDFHNKSMPAELLAIKNKMFQLEFEKYSLGFLGRTVSGRSDDDFIIEYGRYIDVNDTEKTFRRIHVRNSKYVVGWVVDCDIESCMHCGSTFNSGFKRKHHCRACGDIVCDECSPYVAEIQPLNEESGSKVCKFCFHGVLQHEDDGITTYKSSDALDCNIITRSSAMIAEDLLSELNDTNVRRLSSNKDLNQCIFAKSLFENKIRIKDGPKISRELSKTFDTVSICSISETSSAERLQDLTFPRVADASFVPISQFDGRAEMTIDRSKDVVFSPQYALKLYEHITPRMVDELVLLIRIGDASKARTLLRLGCESLEVAVATSLLHEIIDNIDSILEPNETLDILIDSFGADMNSEDSSHRTVLMKAILTKNEAICHYLIRRGADCLHENSEGRCPLSISIENGIDWVLRTFVENHEQRLLLSVNYERIERYILCLVYGGLTSKLMSLIDSNLVIIEPSGAKELYKICSSNISKLQDPDSTFRLLDMLRAHDELSVDDGGDLGDMAESDFPIASIVNPNHQVEIFDSMLEDMGYGLYYELGAGVNKSANDVIDGISNLIPSNDILSFANGLMAHASSMISSDSNSSDDS